MTKESNCKKMNNLWLYSIWQKSISFMSHKTFGLWRQQGKCAQLCAGLDGLNNTPTSFLHSPQNIPSIIGIPVVPSTSMPRRILLWGCEMGNMLARTNLKTWDDHWTNYIWLKTNLRYYSNNRKRGCNYEKSHHFMDWIKANAFLAHCSRFTV